MPYKDIAKKREYQRERSARIRKAWLTANGPCGCGESKHLQVVNTSENRIKPRGIWSWSDEGREIILRDCKAMCPRCSREHHANRFRKMYSGQQHIALKLAPELVWSIRGRLLGRESMRAIARAFDVDHSVIRAICAGKTWAWLKGGRRKVYGIQKTKELTD